MFKVGDIVIPYFDDGLTNGYLEEGEYYKIVEIVTLDENYSGGSGCRVTHLKTGDDLGWYTTLWFKPAKEYMVKMLLDKLENGGGSATL